MQTWNHLIPIEWRFSFLRCWIIARVPVVASNMVRKGKERQKCFTTIMFMFYESLVSSGLLRRKVFAVERQPLRRQKRKT